MRIYTPPRPAAVIPVIDISGPPAAVGKAIGKVCREIGFFYIAGHGVPEELIARQFAAAKAVLDTPLAEKQALHMKNSPAGAGFEPIGAQILDSQEDGGDLAPVDLKESFYCTTNLPSENARTQARTSGHNQWPDLPGFREQTLVYGDALQLLGDRVLQQIALSLELRADWFAPYYAGAEAKLRMLRYPPQKADAEFNQIGAGAHTDWGGITLLAQDSLGGLEVCDVNGTWVRADPIPGTFVVNLGDLMMRWTNGRYASNFHRVRNNHGAADRYSLAFFYSPRSDAVIDPIPSCINADRPRRFATCTAGEHVREMFRRSYGY